jgi:putative ABC transport system ATP-binding protein
VAGVKGEIVEDIVAEVLGAHNLRRLVAETILDISTGLGGSRLATVFQERAAFSRAGIKRPDILILDQVLASHDAKTRSDMRGRLQTLLPKTTLIFMEDNFDNPDAYDMLIEIKNGRIDGQDELDASENDGSASDDLRRKLKVISRTELFAGLDARNQRLLAFSAQWYSAPKGKRVFSMNERPDAAYLCLSGRAMMSYSDPDGTPHEISEVGPGRLIGDLAIILNEPRQLDLIAMEDTQFLRIGAEQFRAVIETDAGVLMSLLKTVARHLTGAAELLREARLEIPQEAGPPSPPVNVE